VATSGVLIEFTDTLAASGSAAREIEWPCLTGPDAGIRAKDGVQVGNITAIYGKGSEIWIGGEFGLQLFDQGRFHTIQAIDKDRSAESPE